MFLMVFSACGGVVGELKGTWVYEGIGRVPGNYPNKIELFSIGIGRLDGKINQCKTKSGNKRTVGPPTLFCTFYGTFYYELSDSKLILSPMPGINGGDVNRVTYIKAEEAYAKREERARKEEEIRKEEEAAAEKAWNEVGASFNTDMVFVEGGTFMMGCLPEQENDCSDIEKPAHKVTLSDFYIGKYEVKQAQWVAVMGNNPSSSPKTSVDY